MAEPNLEAEEGAGEAGVALLSLLNRFCEDAVGLEKCLEPDISLTRSASVRIS